jgi:hypothetical protein
MAQLSRKSRSPTSQTLPDDLISLGFWGAGSANEVVYDYGPYDRAMSDPALWVVKAEERTAWSTEPTLFENNPSTYSFSHILVWDNFNRNW